MISFSNVPLPVVAVDVVATEETVAPPEVENLLVGNAVHLTGASAPSERVLQVPASGTVFW